MIAEHIPTAELESFPAANAGHGGVRWRPAQICEALLLVVAVGWCVLRFVNLSGIPAGLNPDEAMSGLQVGCLGQTGRVADGTPWPMFAGGLGGGMYSPTYLYALLAWTHLFGISVSSLRSLSAFFSILAIVGVGALGHLVAGARAGRLAAVAGALSPWSFQVARLAVDAPMTPALVVWGAYLFLRSPRAVWAAAGGVVLGFAAYTYPPVRVLVPLLSLLLLLVDRKRLDRVRVFAFLGAMGLLCIPLGLRILDGTLTGRARALSIFAPEYIQAHRGPLSPITFLVKQVLENLFEHLRPSYLFFTGDANIRHSTQIMGELGWLDILAVGCSGVALGALVWKAFDPGDAPATPPSRNWLVAGAAVLVGAMGTLPAAMCWESIPHAFRSMAIWPASSLFTGAVLSTAWSRSKLVPGLALALAVAQTVHFVPYYFRVYPKASYEGWDGALREAASAHDAARFAVEARRYPALAFRYQLMIDFDDNCVSSEAHAARILAGGQ